MRLFLLLTSAFILTSTGCAGGVDDTPDAPNAVGDALRSADAPTSAPPELRSVKPGLYRGGHPDADALAYLKSIGVTTIVSLQQPDGSVIEGDKADEVADEEATAQELGLTYVSIPMSSWSSSATYDANWDEARKYVESPTGTYVHCQHGHDRTGLVMALERVLVEGWDAQRAHDELAELGHSRLLFRIDRYYWSKVSDAAAATRE